MQAVAELQDTPPRPEMVPAGCGVCWIFQLLPFHLCASG